MDYQPQHIAGRSAPWAHAFFCVYICQQRWTSSFQDKVLGPTIEKENSLKTFTVGLNNDEREGQRPMVIPAGSQSTYLTTLHCDPHTALETDTRQYHISALSFLHWIPGVSSPFFAAVISFLIFEQVYYCGVFQVWRRNTLSIIW
jgi:hypothetical protein